MKLYKRCAIYKQNGGNYEKCRENSVTPLGRKNTILISKTKLASDRALVHGATTTVQDRTKN